jgi:3-hydroxybutyryl-CoA dehydrogenase
MSKNIESVAILEGGFMGVGIAESASLAELPVLIRELPDDLAAARTRLEKSVDSAVKRGKLDADKRDAALARVTFTSELNDVAGSDLVVETVPEDVQLKVSIMKELNEIVGDDTILASNTSAIPIADLAGAVSRPGRVVGLHFFSPVPVMKLVEIARALEPATRRSRVQRSSSRASVNTPSRRRTAPCSSSTSC